MEENNNVALNNLLDVRQAFSSKDLIENISTAIKTGKVPALEGYTILKRMSKISETVMEDEEIKKMAMTELEKYSGELKGATKSVQLYSASISISAVHTFYDFSQCGHEVLDQLNKIIEHCKEVKDQIEAEIKTIPQPSEKVGEMEFGIKQEGVEKIFAKMPVLSWEDYGGIAMVKPARKVQKIGIRFNKV